MMEFLSRSQCKELYIHKSFKIHNRARVDNKQINIYNEMQNVLNDKKVL